MAALSNEELGLEETKTDAILITTTNPSDTPPDITTEGLEKAKQDAHDKLEEFAADLGKIPDNVVAQNQKDNCTTAITNLQDKLTSTLGQVTGDDESKEAQKKKEEFAKNCQDATDMANRMISNIAGLTSGDPVTCVTSTLDIIGSVAVFGGPVGEVAAGICSVLSTIISLFGDSGGKSLSDIVTSIVNNAIDDLEKDVIYATFQTDMDTIRDDIDYLNGFAQTNGGIITDPVQLDSISIGDKYIHRGQTTISTVKTQLSDYLVPATEEAKQRNKQKYLPKYLYYYCAIFQFKRILLTLQCSLLRGNNKDNQVLDKFNDDEIGRFNPPLSFLNDLPSPKNDWHLFYRNMHDYTILNENERAMISNALTILGIKMPGQLVRFVNIAVGDACVISVPKSGSTAHNDEVVPGSFTGGENFGHYNAFITGTDPGSGEVRQVEQEQFIPTCNLFRKLTPKEALGEEFTGVESKVPHGNGFCLFSVATGNYLFLSTNQTFNHALYGYNAREKGEPDKDHLNTMVFDTKDHPGANIKNFVLYGGCDSDDWDAGKWRTAHCWVKRQSQGYGQQETHYTTYAVFNSTKFDPFSNPANDTFYWFFTEYDYGTYTKEKVEITIGFAPDTEFPKKLKK